MRVSKRQLRRIIKEEKAKLMENSQQMSLNQSGVDALMKMADQIEPMFEIFRKTAGQSSVGANHHHFDKVESILLDLPFWLEEIAEAMGEQGVEGGLK